MNSLGYPNYSIYLTIFSSIFKVSYFKFIKLPKSNVCADCKTLLIGLGESLMSLLLVLNTLDSTGSSKE